jgi:hypothetical protein
MIDPPGLEQELAALRLEGVDLDEEEAELRREHATRIEEIERRWRELWTATDPPGEGRGPILPADEAS